MCGRYYVDDETAREIEKIVRQVNDKLMREKREIYPAARAPVIIGKGNALTVEEYTWGFPHYDRSKKVIFNARSETVLDKKMFKSSVQERRCIIPAAGFFEWNTNKDKYFFKAKDNRILLFAGFYHHDRFVILTTAANDSVEDIHNRMPLILEPSEVDNWIFDDHSLEFILQKKPKQLKREIAGQMSLFDETAGSL